MKNKNKKIDIKDTTSEQTFSVESIMRASDISRAEIIEDTSNSYVETFNNGSPEYVAIKLITSFWLNKKWDIIYVHKDDLHKISKKRYKLI